MKNATKLFFLIFLYSIFLTKAYSAGEKIDLLKTDWRLSKYKTFQFGLNAEYIITKK